MIKRVCNSLYRSTDPVLFPISQSVCKVGKEHTLGYVVARGERELLTHGFELANQLLLAPLGPFLPVCVDGAQDRPARLPTVVHSRDVQVVDKHNVWVLHIHTHTHVHTQMDTQTHTHRHAKL